MAAVLGHKDSVCEQQAEKKPELDDLIHNQESHLRDQLDNKHVDK